MSTTTNNQQPTTRELAAGLAVLRAVADIVRELGRAPRGAVYSALMARGISMASYSSIERALVNTGLVRVEFDQLIWNI